MEKLLTICNCSQCINFKCRLTEFGFSVPYCRELERDVNTSLNFEFPDNCPLPDNTAINSMLQQLEKAGV